MYKSFAVIMSIFHNISFCVIFLFTFTINLEPFHVSPSYILGTKRPETITVSPLVIYFAMYLAGLPKQ